MAGVEHGSGAPTHRTPIPGTLRDSEVKYFQEPHPFENTTLPNCGSVARIPLLQPPPQMLLNTV